MHQEPPSAPAWSTHRVGRFGSPPVVFLHGFMGTHQDWSSVASEVNADCLLVDLPGHGETPLGTVPTLDTWAAELADEIDSAFGGPAFVVGYSMGGRLALRLAQRFPERVRRLALISASPGIEDQKERTDRAAFDSARAVSIRADFEAFRAQWYAAPLFALNEEQAAHASARRAAMDPESAATLIETLSPGRQPSSWAVLDGLRGPVLAVCGERDTKYAALTRRVAERLSERVVRVELAGVGHSVHLDAPKALSPLINEWLNA